MCDYKKKSVWTRTSCTPENSLISTCPWATLLKKVVPHGINKWMLLEAGMGYVWFCVCAGMCRYLICAPCTYALSTLWFVHWQECFMSHEWNILFLKLILKRVLESSMHTWNTIRNSAPTAEKSCGDCRERVARCCQCALFLSNLVSNLVEKSTKSSK